MFDSGWVPQKASMIRFSAEFKEGGSLAHQNLDKGAMQILSEIRGQGLSPVGCDKDNMQLEKIDDRKARTNE